LIKAQEAGNPAARHQRTDDSIVISQHMQHPSDNKLEDGSIYSTPLASSKKEPSAKKILKKKSANHLGIITRTYDSLPTPESPLSTLIFLSTLRLEMSPFILRLGHSPKRNLPQVKISESQIIARLPVTHPQSPRAQPVQPAITAQSCRRAVQSTTYCHHPLLSNHHNGHSHHSDYNALRLDSTVWVDCP
jgi:hypothetical protein